MYHPDLLRHPDSCPALVLNADYTPLSYYPLSLWPWQTAVKAMFLDRVDVVAHYEREVRSPTARLQLPSVIALKQYVKPSQFPAFTRFNLFLRDQFCCQYCGSPKDLTLTMSCHARRAGARPGKMSRLPARRATSKRAGAPPCRRICISTPCQAARRAGSCRIMAAAIRPISSTRAGATGSIGMSNSKPDRYKKGAPCIA